MSPSSDAHAPITEHPAASLVFTLAGVALVLPVHEMTLHIHPLKGSGDGLCVVPLRDHLATDVLTEGHYPTPAATAPISRRCPRLFGFAQSIWPVNMRRECGQSVPAASASSESHHRGRYDARRHCGYDINCS